MSAVAAGRQRQRPSIMACTYSFPLEGWMEQGHAVYICQTSKLTDRHIVNQVRVHTYCGSCFLASVFPMPSFNSLSCTSPQPRSRDSPRIPMDWSSSSWLGVALILRRSPRQLKISSPPRLSASYLPCFELPKRVGTSATPSTEAPNLSWRFEQNFTRNGLSFALCHTATTGSVCRDRGFEFSSLSLCRRCVSRSRRVLPYRIILTE